MATTIADAVERTMPRKTTPQARYWDLSVHRDWLEAVARAGKGHRLGSLRSVASALAVMGHLQDGYSFPQQERLSQCSGVAQQANVSRAICWLDAQGFITRFRPSRSLLRILRKRSRGKPLSLGSRQNVYIVHLPKHAEEIRLWHAERGMKRLRKRRKKDPAKHVGVPQVEEQTGIIIGPWQKKCRRRAR